MNSRTFIGMAVAAAVFVVLAIQLTRSREQSTAAAAADEHLFPSLADTINDVTSVTVEDPEGSFTLVREDGDWGLTEKGGYPVDTGKVRTLLLGLVDATKVEAKTDSPERYEMLGVQDVSEEGADGTRITLAGEGGAELASLIVGHERDARGPRGGAPADASEYYVRPAGDGQSWLVRGTVSADQDPAAWLVKDVVDVDRKRIRAVRIEHADGEQIYVRREDKTATDFDIVNLPEGKVVTYASAPGTLAGGLSRLTMEDVLPDDEVDFPSPADAVCTFWTFDGLEVVASVHQTDDKLYARFEASYDEVGPPGTEPDASPPADDGDASEQANAGDDDQQADDEAAEEDAGPTPEEVREEAAKIEARVSGWTYVLPSWKKGSFMKRMEELVKDEEPPATEEPTPPAGLEDQLDVGPGEEMLIDETTGAGDAETSGGEEMLIDETAGTEDAGTAGAETTATGTTDQHSTDTDGDDEDG